ncbi:hypothetical protein OAV01_01590 [Opitutales bacterium]|nr:hypothetical protein [Opitutales bacterium]MDB3958014.1 hypothetical protein [Opitutales bacterium]MDC3283946.1 hypothetical protein [Opitutales bacterium]
MTINTILIFLAAMIVVSLFIFMENRSKRNRISPTNLGTAPFRIIKSILVSLLTITLMAGSFLMIGPQIVPILAVSFCLGGFFVFRRSFLSLVFFGYPITFGLVSAYIGYYELNDYANDSEFWVAIGIGAFGTMLVFLGFWKTLFRPEAN